ncbi:MAG: hypothetical protein RMA76_10705 [Deltaproteobacteria bacterium]
MRGAHRREDPLGALSVRVLLLALLAAGCTKTPKTCGPDVYGVAAYDALLGVTYDGGPALYATNVAGLLAGEGAALATALEAAAQVHPNPLNGPARVALQNDVWGVLQRVAAHETSSSTKAAILASAHALVQRLALPASVLESMDGTAAPKTIARFLPGFEEHDTEHVVLGHEHLYGLRRLFRIYVDGDHVALVGQLVAMDTEARPHLTNVLSEIERLDFEVTAPAEPRAVELVRARVFELDRRRLRCRGEGLVEVGHVPHVPGLGANGFLARFGASQDLASLPCASCHDDGNRMSLPIPGNSATRHRRLLGELADAYPEK